MTEVKWTDFGSVRPKDGTQIMWREKIDHEWVNGTGYYCEEDEHLWKAGDQWIAIEAINQLEVK